MTGYPSPRALLDKYGLRAKMSWGQNFLGDEAVLDDIARLAAPRPGARVVELGAGLGHLTARLLAVEAEKDHGAVPLEAPLRQLLAATRTLLGYRPPTRALA